jgi:hypothetical protein
MNPFRWKHTEIEITDREGREVKTLSFDYDWLGHPNFTNSDQLVFDKVGELFKYDPANSLLLRICNDLDGDLSCPTPFANRLFYIQNGNSIWQRMAYSGKPQPVIITTKTLFGMVMFRKGGYHFIFANELTPDHNLMLLGWISKDMTKDFTPLHNPLMVGPAAANAGQPLKDSENTYRIYQDLRLPGTILAAKMMGPQLYREVPKIQLESKALWVARGSNYIARLLERNGYIFSDKELFKLWIKQKLRRRNGSK